MTDRLAGFVKAANARNATLLGMGGTVGLIGIRNIAARRQKELNDRTLDYKPGSGNPKFYESAGVDPKDVVGSPRPASDLMQSFHTTAKANTENAAAAIASAKVRASGAYVDHHLAQKSQDLLEHISPEHAVGYGAMAAGAAGLAYYAKKRWDKFQQNRKLQQQYGIK